MKQRITKKRFLEYYYSPNRPMQNIEPYLDYALRHFELDEAKSYIAEWLYYVFYRTKLVSGKIRPDDINDIISNTWMAIMTQVQRGNYKKKTKPSSWLLTILRITAQTFLRDEYYKMENESDYDGEEGSLYTMDVGADQLIDMGDEENMVLSFIDVDELYGDETDNLNGLKYYLIKTLKKNLVPYIENLINDKVKLDIHKIVNTFLAEHRETLNLYVVNKLNNPNSSKRIRNKKSYRQFFLTYILSNLSEQVKAKLYHKLNQEGITIKKFVQILEHISFAREDMYLILKKKLMKHIEDYDEIENLVHQILAEFPDLSIYNLYKYKTKINNFLQKNGYNFTLWKKRK